MAKATVVCKVIYVKLRYNTATQFCEYGKEREKGNFAYNAVITMLWYNKQ